MMPNIDLILYNAQLFGTGPGNPDAGLIALSDERITVVSTSDRLEEFKKPGTKTINCEGGTLIPGFNDAHLHLYSMVHRELGVDLSPRKIHCIEELQNELRNHACVTQSNFWVRGQGYDDFYLGRHPNRHDLDRAVSGRPVAITHRSLHACVLNSLALELAGISEATEDPQGGAIDREPETGAPSGLIFNMPGIAHNCRTLNPSAEEFSKGLRRVNEYLLSRGVTSVQDAGAANSPERFKELRNHVDRGDIKFRITMLAGGMLLEDFVSQGLSYNQGDYRLRLGVAKYVLNEFDGELEPSEEELTYLVEKTSKEGYPVAIHAIGNAAVEAATRAIGCAKQFSPKALRHRVEHASECTPDIIEQLRGTGIIVVSQPSFLYYSGERYLATVDQEILPYLYPYRSLLAAGVSLAGSSDSPVAPADPLTGIYAAATRHTINGLAVNSSEWIPVGAALHLFTEGSAYAAGEEGVKGTLTPGKLGDFVLLDKNPCSVDPEEIREIKVLLTIIGGKVVWGV